MNKLLTEVYRKAKSDGRLCRRCKWIVTKVDFAKGEVLCSGCRDAMKGVNTPPRFGKYIEEVIDKTGEML